MGQEDPLEEGMATHSSLLAMKIPWTQEPDRLWSMEKQRYELQAHHEIPPSLNFLKYFYLFIYFNF